MEQLNISLSKSILQDFTNFYIQRPVTVMIYSIKEGKCESQSHIAGLVSVKLKQCLESDNTRVDGEHHTVCLIAKLCKS